MRVYWLEQAEKNVPETNGWLCAAEIARLNNFRFAKRRMDWRLGRWTAKRAVAARLNWPTCPQVLARIEIRATPSGAPEAIVASLGTPLVISLSHRAGLGTCAVSEAGVKLGCDLEVIEPRGDAFVADYFTSEEQSLITLATSAKRPEVVTLLWSAKESALKAMREGLRLDTRSVSVSLVESGSETSGWSPLCVRCVDGQVLHGWWRTKHGIVHTVVADPASGYPICLAFAEGSRDAEKSFDHSAGMTMKAEIVSIAGQ